ncbi:MAG TPA: DinB family protein [Pyrinomonadaceae bacterium]|nr:DinB family protein [Pyrinomonadaceae bacterium]
MHPRIEEVINYLDGERAALRDAVEQVPAELRDKQPGSDRWSVAQVLEHLGIIEKRVGLGLTKWVSEARDTLGPEADTSSVMNSLPRQLIIDRSQRRNAPEEVRPPGEIDAKRAWEVLEGTRETLRSAFLSGDGLALSEVVQPHPILGPINIYQWLLFVGSHEERHTAQILEIAEQFKAEPGAAAGSAPA